MNAIQVIIGVFGLLLLISLLYVGFRYAAYQLDKRLPRPVQVAPSAATVLPENPPTGWWDALQELRNHVDTQVQVMQGFAFQGEQAYRNARSSEERARKRERAREEYEDEDEGLPPAQPVAALSAGWENSQLAPGGQVPLRRDAYLAEILARRARES